MKALNSWKKNAQSLMKGNPNGYKTHKAYIAVLEHIYAIDWSGACHATTAVIASILKAQGVIADPFIGECQEGNIYFDHSWVLVDGEIFDVAVSNTLIQGLHFPPVYRGYDLTTSNPTSIAYGVVSGRGYDPTAEMIRRLPVLEYMSNFPGYPEGLFGVAEQISRQMGNRISAAKLQKGIAETIWCERT
jgi:predicted heme/steroid binding protein